MLQRVHQIVGETGRGELSVGEGYEENAKPAQGV